MNELALDVAHVVRVVVDTGDNSLLSQSDIGTSSALSDGAPFGIQLILRDEHVRAAGEEEDVADGDQFSAGDEVHRAFMSRLG